MKALILVPNLLYRSTDALIEDIIGINKHLDLSPEDVTKKAAFILSIYKDRCVDLGINKYHETYPSPYNLSYLELNDTVFPRVGHLKHLITYKNNVILSAKERSVMRQFVEFFESESRLDYCGICACIHRFKSTELFNKDNFRDDLLQAAITAYTQSNAWILIDLLKSAGLYTPELAFSVGNIPSETLQTHTLARLLRLEFLHCFLKCDPVLYLPKIWRSV
jgi:hypothetical protein